MFVGQQFDGRTPTTTSTSSPSPRSTPTYGAGRVEAPIDGFMLSKKPEERGGRQGAAEVPRHAPRRRTPTCKTDPNNIATTKDADTSGYSALQKKAVELIAGAKQISQFMDRDTRPDFASTVMIPAIQEFIKNPNDIDGLTKKIEDQKKTIFTSMTVVTSQRRRDGAPEAARARSRLTRATASC